MNIQYETTDNLRKIYWHTFRVFTQPESRLPRISPAQSKILHNYDENLTSKLFLKNKM